jgi:hypothetical protein
MTSNSADPPVAMRLTRRALVGRLAALPAVLVAGHSPWTHAAPNVTGPGAQADPPIVGRAAWGAAASAGGYRDHEPTRVTVHHTAVRWSGGDTSAHIRQIQAFHQGRERGWVDIAYHYLLDRDGTVYEGRPVTAVPDTATSYDPTGHLTICLLGDFELQQPADAQLDALVDLSAWLLRRYGLAPSVLGSHQDYAATLCPGRPVYALIRDGSLAARVVQLLAAESPSGP